MAGSEDKITSLLKGGKSFAPPEEGRDQAFVKF
jgi:hypothetical protein